MNNLKQLILALHNYESCSIPSSSSPGRGDEPVGEKLPSGCIGSGATPEERLSWMVALTPFLDPASIYNQFDLAKGYPGNLPAAQTKIKVFLCPAAKQEETSDAVTHYVAMSGIGRDAASQPAGAAGNGFMGYDRLTSLKMIKDGASNTIALMETRSGLGPWARGGPTNLRGFDPSDLPLHGDQRPFGGHPGLMIVGMADGAVRAIPSSVEPKKIAAAITIDGGEPGGLD